MKNLLFVLFILSIPVAKAQERDSVVTRAHVFQLGEVQVLGDSPDSLQMISSRKIEKFNRTEISGALNMMSGITLGNVGPRNESVVYVRGFDLRQVPVFIDGIPVYVPYDGYVDMGRFTTMDLSEINVAKGFASILYGANTMGGAINLVSRRPQERFEINGRVGVFSGDGFRWNVNAGSNFGKFYYQLGLSQLKQDYFPLSDDFGHANGMGGQRQNSYRNDQKLSVKAGFTPNSTDEYVIGYTNQSGEKGNPPYVGNDPNVMVRYWQWPKWDKESIYLMSNTALGGKSALKTRWYYDAFDNALFSYDDSTYSTMNRPYAFESYYDDYTLGGSADFETRMIKNNLLKLGVQLKRDIHRENNQGEPQRRFVDNTLAIGVENIYSVLPVLTIVPGISYNRRTSAEAQDYNSSTQEIIDFPSNDNDAVNAQLGVFWDFYPKHQLRGTIARKTRFATIKDRYSYRMGSAIPNPDLMAEVATNYDLTYNGRLTDKLSVSASLYRSDISDIIQQVDNVEPGRFQLQNAGDALFYGTEVNIDYAIVDGLDIGGNYSYIRQKNITNPDLKFLNVPAHKIFGHISYSWKDRASILGSTEYNSDRFSTSYGTIAEAYTLLNVKASVRIISYVSIEAGINNLLDENYALVEGFPEAGRNFFLSLSFTNR